ncbi:class I adenylate-forming enzyme family protein [Streptomyces cadmiisoli]|uniref:class I adenylate-forming enzyme family protein n=1 Tax=Streptomyces cadmiisoli TaxID=2184053 RepID=UPI0018EFEDB7|nr:class I adenylate-forming enzyme family protein [Streptomyces cadmiisoli]
MILQRIGNRGLFLGAFFDDAAKKRPYQRITLDHELDIAPELGSDLTVHACANLVGEMASALRDVGVRPGDRVAVHKRDCFDIFLLTCAVARVGAVPVALSPTLRGDTVAQLLERCDRPHLITDEQTLVDGLPPDVVKRCAGVLLVTGEADGTTPLRRDPEARPRPFTRPRADRPALLTHTSGTTDTPKLVVHTSRSLRARYRPQALGARLLIRDRETLAVRVSFVHSRLVTALAIALERGFPIVVLKDAPPERVADLFAEVKPGILEAHPNTFVEWEPLADDPRGPLSNVLALSSTFDAIHPRTVRKILGASHRRRPFHLQLYGQSEIGPTVGRATSRRRAMSVDGRCVGFPFPGMTAVRVVDRDGLTPGPGTPGFIEVRSDGRALTYVGEEARFQRQLDDGWWRMGDVGYRTRWGCLHVSDREVDVIPGFGSALEAEDVLMSRLDALLEVVVVPGREGAPTPVVVTRDGAPLDPDRWAKATAGLPAMRPPVQLSLDELPRTATAKVQRLELAKRLLAADPAGRPAT